MSVDIVDVQLFCWQVGQPRGQERDGNIGQVVLDAVADLADHEGDGEADHDGADCRDEEAGTDLPDRDRAGDRGDGRTQGDDSGGVVDQAFTLEDRDDSAGQPDLAGNCCGRDRVGRGDHGAESQGRSKGNRQDPPHQQTDAEGREDDQSDTQQQDRTAVLLEVDQRHTDRRGIQQGWKQSDEDKLGCELVVGDERHV